MKKGGLFQVQRSLPQRGSILLVFRESAFLQTVLKKKSKQGDKNKGDD